MLNIEYIDINAKLCSELLTSQKINRAKVQDLIHLYVDQNSALNYANRTIEELQHQITILEAENKFLKELNA